MTEQLLPITELGITKWILRNLHLKTDIIKGADIVGSNKKLRMVDIRVYYNNDSFRVRDIPLDQVTHYPNEWKLE